MRGESIQHTQLTNRINYKNSQAGALRAQNDNEVRKRTSICKIYVYKYHIKIKVQKTVYGLSTLLKPFGLA